MTIHLKKNIKWMDKNKQFIQEKIGLVLFYIIVLILVQKNLTVEKVNNETGAYLHQFKWCKDDEIGSLDERWNWLEGWTSGHNNKKPYAVHYTRGGPWFSEWQDVEFANEWLLERDEYLSKKFNSNT